MKFKTLLFGALFVLSILDASALNTVLMPIDKTAISSAHTVFVAEPEPYLGVDGGYIALLRAGLVSSKRFTVMPTADGADVILLLYGASPQTPAGGQDDDSLLLQAHDGKTFAYLGSVKACHSKLSAAKNGQVAVTDLLNAFFALDDTRPAPSFVVPMPEVARHSLNTSWSTGEVRLPTGGDKILAEARSVFIEDRRMKTLGPEYSQSGDELKKDIVARGRFQVTSSLEGADLLLIYNDQSDCVSATNGQDRRGPRCERDRNALSLSVYSASTMQFLFHFSQNIKTGAAAAGVPSNFQAKLLSLEAEFEKTVVKKSSSKS